MPAIDDPFSIAASLPGQMADMKRQIKDLSSNNTQAATLAAIANVVRPAAASAVANNFAIPGDVSVSVISLTIPIPLGFTSALVTGNVAVTGMNMTTQTSYLNAYIQINSIIGGLGGLGGRAINGQSTQANGMQIQNLTGLTPGGVITVQGFASVVSASGPPTTLWAASIGNQAALIAQVIFTR